MEKKELLSKYSVFSDFTDAQLAELAPYIDIVEFDAGETIFGEREKAVNFYGVLKGEVELVLVAQEAILKPDIRYEEYDRSTTENVDREISVDSIGPYEIFGWSALSPEGRYTSKAVSVTAASVFLIAADNLHAYFRQHPEAGYPFMVRLLAIVSERLYKRSDRLVEGWSEAFNVNRI